MCKNISNLSLNSFIDEVTFKLIEKQISTLFKFEVLIVSSKNELIGNIINPSSLYKITKDLSVLKNLYLDSNNFGLKNSISKIISNNIFFGIVIVGQFKIETDINKYYNNLHNFSKKNNIPIKLVLECFGKLSKAYEKDIASMECCSKFIADYISEFISNKIKSNEISYLKNKQLKYIDTIKNIKTKNYDKDSHSYFLFNTLNSISRMAFLENATTTEEMVYCLSDLLRYKYKESEKFPTIASELENIKKYLFIQNIRYKNNLKYYIDIPKNLLNYRIPHMLIEPIIENSLFYVINSKIDIGSISITGIILNNDIKIKIKINNIFISSKEFSSLLNSNIKEHKALDLIHANNRLISYFGSNYGIEVFNTNKEETLMEIKIPCFKEILFATTKERTNYDANYYDC